MSATSVEAAPARYHWTRGAFRRAADAGAFDDVDVQLRHGEVVTRVSPKGPRHAAVVGRLNRELTVQLARAGGELQVRVQDPIARSDDDEPEPDLAVVVAGDYDDDHPGPADIVLLVEVADTSYSSDVRKLADYAAAGIAAVWLVDVVRLRVEVHRTPDPAARTYLEVTTVEPGAVLSLGQVQLDVRDIFGSRASSV